MARKFGFRRKFGNLDENSEEKGKMYFGPEAPPPPPSEKMAKIYHFVRNSILFGVDIQVLSLWEVD